MENNTDIFWQWFTDHNEQLIAMGDLDAESRAALMGSLRGQLHAYCPGLDCEVGEPTANGRTLTFTAEGDTDLFRPLVELTDAAPDLDWWDIVAFKQPMGTDLKVRFDHYRFETAKMYFEQLECEEEPEMLGLRIAVEGGERQDDEDFQVGVYVTVEALLGEFDCATMVGYIETVPLMPEPFKSGFQPLDDLPRFAEWFKRKRDE
ncbi:MAG: hypothetical protein IJ760_06635 [Bacteroidales bacterium]|nr:hypothetical protein [Bacteroidales bacterium]